MASGKKAKPKVALKPAKKPAKPAPKVAPKKAPAPPPKPAKPTKAPAPPPPPPPKPAPPPATKPKPEAKSGPKSGLPVPRIGEKPAVPVLTGPRLAAAPSAPAKPGMMDNQLYAAISYGLFAAINKTFGTFGQSVLKNANLRILEYGYKHGWLPPKSKDPVRALQEFFGRLEAMGYAEKIGVVRKGDEVTVEFTNLAGWEAVQELRELHYPLLPIFAAELITAFVDQYFKLVVHVDSQTVAPERRGLVVKFSIHEKVEPIPPSRLPQGFDEDQFE